MTNPLASRTIAEQRPQRPRPLRTAGGRWVTRSVVLASTIGGTWLVATPVHAQECLVQAHVRGMAMTGVSGEQSGVTDDSGELTTAPASANIDGVRPTIEGERASAEVNFGVTAGYGSLSLFMNCHADTGDPYEAAAYSVATSDPIGVPNARFVDRLTVNHATEANVQIRLTQQLEGSMSLTTLATGPDEASGTARLTYATASAQGALPDLTMLTGYTDDSSAAVIDVPSGGYIDIEQSFTLFAVCSTGESTEAYRSQASVGQFVTMYVDVLTPGAEVSTCSGFYYSPSNLEYDAGAPHETGEPNAGETSAEPTGATSSGVTENAGVTLPSGALDAGGVTVLPADAARPDGDGAVEPDFGISVETVGDTGGLSVDLETVVNDVDASVLDAAAGGTADAAAYATTEIDPALKQHEDDGCVCRTARGANPSSHLAMVPGLGMLVLMLRRRGQTRAWAAR